MTDATLTYTPVPPVRFRPSAPEPLEHEPSLFELFQPEAARNPLTVIPRIAYEIPYRRVRMLHTVWHGIGDPEAIKRCLLDNAQNYERPRLIRRAMRSTIGEGLLTAEGENWRSQRRLMAPVFSPHAVEAFMPLFAMLAERSVDRTPGDGGVVDMAAEASRTTLEVIDEALFSGEAGVAVGEAGERVREMIVGGSTVRLATLFGLSDFDPGRAQRRARTIRRQLLHRLEALIRRRADAADPPEDFITRLYTAFRAEHPRAEAIQLTLDNAITFFVAGQETTANGLAWALYLLSEDPQGQAWARDEARVAWAEAGADPAALLERLPYLKMVWEETLRLYPPAQRIDREALADDELCGRPIRRGEIVTIWPWVLHRHRMLWDEPDLFNPENFDPEAKAGRSRYQYLPFGAGPRICIGMGFAQAEALIILSRWLAEFHFSPAPGRTVEPVAAFTLRAEGGVPLVVERRDG
jgi:cytochrome P450